MIGRRGFLKFLGIAPVAAKAAIAAVPAAAAPSPITAGMLSVEGLSAITANLGDHVAGTLRSSCGTFLIDVDGRSMTIIDPPSDERPTSGGG